MKINILAISPHILNPFFAKSENPPIYLYRYLQVFIKFNNNFYKLMSFSPQKAQAEIDHEIDKRILRDSPNKYDIDYYLRKIARLENQYNTVHDELAKAKVRIRRAEDFQIKFDLLSKQNSNLATELEKKQRDICDLKAKNEYFKTKLEEKESKGQDWSVERRMLQEQIDNWKNKAEDAEDRRANEVKDIKQKCDEMIKRQQDLIRRDFAQKQESYQFQIRQLKKIVHEKETVQALVSNKVAKVREQKDQQIIRLGKIIQKQKADHLTAIDEKNEQFDKMREKFEKMFNFELENIKKNQEDQDELFNIELNGLREMIGLKNDEISKLYEHSKKNLQAHQLERQQLLNEIQLLKDKIFAIESENELQIVNLKERLTKIHAVEIDALERRYSDLIKTLKVDKEELEKMIKQKDKQIQGERKEVDRIRQELLDRIKERQSRIIQLQERLKDTGDVNATQMKHLHESFHKIETEKEMMTSQYQANVGFLNQQIAKLTSNNELKNNEIKKLHEEIAELKNHYADNIKDLELKWKQERKDREQQREKERNRRQSMEEEFRIKERDWKIRERQLEREKQKEEREKSKLKYICEELQKDIQRLNEYIKQLDQNLKKELKKNQVSTLDTGGIRRELTAELQRQKSELEALKRMEVDQIKKKYQIEVSRLTNQNEKLQTDLLNKSIAYQNLEGEFKKLEHINKNIDRLNKEKLVEYQKKMATLNNQINITQNLYQSFIEAKSRSGKKPNA